ncbi:unnamed protein product [Phyllotreta striolata]|uniref:Carboxylic ester hydrolase n=1 Tax=Phyllotreta striolata TaxID=444603 RepID=A0A9N9TR86_PHYSR|nr:unnamed protein product [Phyllotreta striolata]
MIHLKALLGVLSLLLATIAAQNDGPVINLEKGKIRGLIRESENGNKYYAFQEIPFAAPPVGPNRFQVPKEPPQWDGILNTTRNTKRCYQSQLLQGDVETIESEDCLYLNVYSPDIHAKKLLPVLLWIHGGAFVTGSAVFGETGPKYIMDQDIVVVTTNYRLGAFGFVGTDDEVIPLNLGLKDQRLAMEWVNKNIHLFGGNPKHVVLAGESAGSISVGFHLISQRPNEEQLFQAAIMQSGTPIASGLKQSDSTQNAFDLGRRLDKNFSSKDSKELLNVLQKADAKDIVSAFVIGGVSLEKEGLFSHLGYQAFIDQKYQRVPVLIGFNSEEWLFVGKNETQLKEIDKDPSLLIPARVNVAPGMRPTVGKLLKEIYTQNTSFEEDFGGFVRFTSDSMFINGVCKLVELSCENAPYYLYQFAYKGVLGESMNIPPYNDTGNVVHAEDLRYMWDDGKNSDLRKFPAEDVLMLHRFVKMWTNFVKYFNPTPQADPLLQNISWKPSEPNTIRYLNINSTLEMRNNPRQYAQVKEVLDKYLVAPFDSMT